jgi:hypothetical protein
MTAMDAKRLTALAGVAFVAVWLVALFGFGGTDSPEGGASAGEVVSFYEQHLWQQATVAFLLAASVPFLLLFAATVARAWSGREAAGGRFLARQLVVGGSILAGGAVLMLAVVHFSLANGADEGVSQAALQTLNVLDANFWVAFNAGLGTMLLGAAGLAIPEARSPTWLGWAALVLGIALFVPFADFFALLLTAVWIVVASVTLSRSSPEPRPTVRVQPAHPG